MGVINQFKGQYHFLSNFYPSTFIFRNEVWPSVEHFYQGYKTTIPELRERIRLVSRPNLAKKLGSYRTYQGQPVMRDNWNELKLKAMVVGINCKFDQNPDLAKLLINTYNKILVEGNSWHDNFWGNCTCIKCVDIKGLNWLGRILMGKRQQLMEI